jgi:hypothetical protein
MNSITSANEMCSITACSDITTLYVGIDKVQIACHKSLLGFFSRFFESALYGNFAEAASGEVHLPEDEVKPIQDFVSWLYSGQSPQEREVETALEKKLVGTGPTYGEDVQYITTPPTKGYLPDDPAVIKLENCKLELNLLSRWLLGDKLISPRFTSYIMSFLLKVYSDCRHPYCSWEAEFAYDNTVVGSELRLLFKDLIATDGPLRDPRWKNRVAQLGERDRWVLLLERGGDLVKEYVLDGFANFDADIGKLPWGGENRKKYMQKVANISVEEWIQEKYPAQVAIKAPLSPQSPPEIGD